MRKINLLFSLVIVFFLYFSAKGEESSWYRKLKQIKPLISSKQDIERIFASPKIRRTFEDDEIEFVLYETSEGKFTVEYSTSKCSSNNKKTYNVEKGIVIRIIFFPKKEEKLSKFKVDKKLLIKTREGDDPAWHYVNDKFGVDFSVIKGKVIDVKFYPSSSYDYLKCK